MMNSGRMGGVPGGREAANTSHVWRSPITRNRLFRLTQLFMSVRSLPRKLGDLCHRGFPRTQGQSAQLARAAHQGEAYGPILRIFRAREGTTPTGPILRVES